MIRRTPVLAAAPAKFIAALAIVLLEILRAGHEVDKVEGGVNPLEGPVE